MSGRTVVLLHSAADLSSGVTTTPIPRINGEAVSGLPHSNGILELVGLVFVLIVILVVAYYTTKLVGKVSMGQFKNSNFKAIDTYRISPNKFLQIVKIGNKFVVIAVGKDTVTYITELDESEVYVKDVYAKENINFKQILEKMRNKTD